MPSCTVWFFMLKRLDLEKGCLDEGLSQNGCLEERCPDGGLSRNSPVAPASRRDFGKSPRVPGLSPGLWGKAPEIRHPGRISAGC